MPTHRYSNECEVEIDKIIRDIIEENPSAAPHWFDRLEAKCRNLAAFPRMGRVRDDFIPGLHVFPFGNYLIFYDIEPAGIVVLHVVDGRRDVPALFAPTRDTP